MLDQEIYKEIGTLIYNESPDVSVEVHLVVHRNNGVVDSVAWYGSTLSKESSFHLSSSALRQLHDTAHQLHSFYEANNLGNWNVLHYILEPNGGKFRLDLEDNQQLKKDEIPFWKYAKKFSAIKSPGH